MPLALLGHMTLRLVPLALVFGVLVSVNACTSTPDQPSDARVEALLPDAATSCDCNADLVSLACLCSVTHCSTYGALLSRPYCDSDTNTTLTTGCGYTVLATSGQLVLSTNVFQGSNHDLVGGIHGTDYAFGPCVRGSYATKIPSLVDCPDFSQRSLCPDAGSTDHLAPSQCRDQCELAGTCDPIPFEDYSDFDTTRDQWAGECHSQRFVVAGTCADGKLVLRRHNGSVSELRIYDSDGNFLGLETTTDVLGQVCHGRGYWPEVVPCKSPTVTDVLCGDLLDIGDPVDDGHWGD